jgi:hypothetical protein
MRLNIKDAIAETGNILVVDNMKRSLQNLAIRLCQFLQDDIYLFMRMW